jgi:3-dehydroquinate synthase
LDRVTVPIPGRSYEVTVGVDVVEGAGAILPDLGRAARAFVVVDAAVADPWLGRVTDALETRSLHVVPLTVPSGEAAKTMDVYGTLLHQLASQEAHRDDIVVALGGGTVGDLAGFVASTYMRGLGVVQVPTTLIGQVDAAIGGKTAVNLPEGKNLVGTFHQPLAVLCDVGALATLPVRDFRSGLAEVAKYGLALDPSALEALVTRCVRIKAATVAADERDAAGRLFLNYGHTLGHALERLDAFAGRSHGEAVAIGMVFAARLATARGIAGEDLTRRTVRVLSSLGLETDGPLPPPHDILTAFRMDKKFHGGVRFVLLRGVGEPTIVEGVTEEELRAVLQEMGAAA